MLGSCYVAQSEEADDFHAELLQHVAALSSGTRWMLMGDWNMTPVQNGLLASLQRRDARLAAVTNASMDVLPTRWEGRRAIDYIIAHETCVISGLTLGEAHYNDHKLLRGSMRVAKAVRHVDWQLCSAARYLPPDDFPADRWSELLYEGWRQAAPLPAAHGLSAETCDSWWTAAMAKLEDVFKHAWLASRDSVAPSGRVLLPKGRPNSADLRFRAQTPVKRHPEGSHASNRLCCLRALLNRLLALRAHFLEDTLHTVEAVNLQRKIRRCPHLPDVQGHSARIQAVKDLIAVAEKQQHDDHIKAWKSRLKASDAACYKWVRGPAAPLSHMVCLGPAICSDSLDGALLHLRDFWRGVWERPLPDLQSQLNACLGVLGPQVPPSEWTSLTAQELKAAAKTQRGSGAGLDGWTGDEVASIPLEIWDELLPFYLACERLGVVPDGWRKMRQVHLPKPNKPNRATDGATPAASMRPISVIIVSWRVYASARFKSASSTAWCQTWLPSDGRKGAHVYRAASRLLEPVSDGWYLGSFDYSLAFDHVRPGLVCCLMKHWGMPMGLADMLLSLWGRQERYL